MGPAGGWPPGGQLGARWCPGRRARGQGEAATRVEVSPGESDGNPTLSAHPLSRSQELVREMVDADVELMRNNPNA